MNKKNNENREFMSYTKNSSPSEYPAPDKQNKNSNRMIIIIAAVILLVALIFTGVFLAVKTKDKNNSESDRDDYSNSSSQSDSESSSSNTINSIDDLPGAVIGVQSGTSGDFLVSLEYNEFKEYNSGLDAVQALSNGEIDCVVMDLEPAEKFVADNRGLKILDEPFAVEEYAICVAKDNNELKDEINEALAELKKNGTVDQIIKNYIGNDTKGTCPYVSPENVDRSKGTLTMVTNTEFEPYVYGENGEVVGIDAMLARAICDYLGYDLEIRTVEFDSIIAQVSDGKADFGIAGITITEERLESVDFTDAYTTSTQVVIVKE